MNPAALSAHPTLVLLLFFAGGNQHKLIMDHSGIVQYLFASGRTAYEKRSDRYYRRAGSAENKCYFIGHIPVVVARAA